MDIFEITKRILKEEVYSFMDQKRKSSRIGSITVAEAYRKREHPNFYSKLIDADAEKSKS